jgi:hypothetical protein
MRCSLCDEAKRTKHRIPACKRPARHWDVDLRSGQRIYMCEFHFQRVRKNPLWKARCLLALWLRPMAIRCGASGHNTERAQSCTCRQNALRKYTMKFLMETKE